MLFAGGAGFTCKHRARKHRAGRSGTGAGSGDAAEPCTERDAIPAGVAADRAYVSSSVCGSNGAFAVRCCCRWIQDPQQALPGDHSGLQDGGAWNVQSDLLSSGPTAFDFVVEMENDGAAHLRFGDGVLGAEPVGVLTAAYRTGNGSQGNVGAEALAHILATPAQPFTGITNIRNPIAAQGGTDAESLDQVRSFAPFAFRTQERAVTVDDYATVTERYPLVKQAKANLRWTGSWYTVFVTVDRVGGQPVDAAFQSTIRNFLEQFRLAGYDLEIQPPTFVALDIAFTVCVAPGYFRNDVKATLLDAFSNRILPSGQSGFFYPDNFDFGQPVYLSQIVSTAMQVSGRGLDRHQRSAALPEPFQTLGAAVARRNGAGQDGTGGFGDRAPR